MQSQAYSDMWPPYVQNRPKRFYIGDYSYKDTGRLIKTFTDRFGLDKTVNYRAK